MAPSGEVLHALSAVVKTEDGRRVTLRKGDTLPVDVASGEAERLRALNVYGPPKNEKVDDRDEAQVFNDELAREHREQFGDEDEEVTEAVVEDGAGESSEDGESEGAPEPEEDRVGLAAYLKTASVADVLDRVAKEPDVAPILLELEQEATKPRKSLVSGLEAVVEDGAGG